MASGDAPLDLEAARESATREVQAALQTGAVRESPELPEALRHLPEQDVRLGLDLKRLYAVRILWILGGQLAIADAVFVIYAWSGKNWDLSTAVIDTWLGATVVQIVGVALVVTRHLFPRRDSRP